MAKKNSEVMDAPKPEEILKDMQASAPVSKPETNDITSLLSGYTDAPKIDIEGAQEFEKSKRGRKKGQKNGMKAEDVKDPLAMDQPVINENPVITGGLLILLIDLVLPNLICFVANKVSKGTKIKASSLQLDEDEKKQLEPLAEQVAKEMAVKANPLTVLIISLVGMYGMKLMMQKSS